jgi:hypothetical protein
MRREELKRKDSVRVQVPMRSTGAEQLVVAVIPVKAGGAKGLHRPVGFVDQPVAGGVDDEVKVIQHLEGDGVGRFQSG